MNILLSGLGALGTVYACLLQKHDHNVTVITRDQYKNHVINNGVKICGIWGEHDVFVTKVISDDEEVGDQVYQLAIMAVKSFDLEKAINQIAKLISNDTYILLLQNGYGNYEVAAKFIPEERIILGRVIFGSELLSVGEAKVTVFADDVIIGSPNNLVELSILEEFAEQFKQAGIPTRFSTEIMKYIWGKIIYNSALNSLGAIFEVNYGRLAEVQESKGLMDSIISEIFYLLKSVGQETLWQNDEDYMTDFYEKLVPATYAHYSSMLQDIQRGKKTEINSLNGAIVELGKFYGISTTVNQIITELVRAKEKIKNN